MSPRSSVTVGSLLSGQAVAVAVGWSSQRRLGVDGSGPAARRSGRRCAAAAEVAGAPARLRMPARRVAELVGGGRVELGERVADDPGAVAVVGRGGALGLGAQGRLGGGAVDDGQRAIGPRQRLLDVRLGVADQLRRGAAGRAAATVGSRPRRRSTWVIVAIVEPTRRRSQRDGL